MREVERSLLELHQVGSSRKGGWAGGIRPATGRSGGVGNGEGGLEGIDQW
jgi:hypothetical protein